MQVAYVYRKPLPHIHLNPQVAAMVQSALSLVAHVSSTKTQTPPALVFVFCICICLSFVLMELLHPHTIGS